MLQHIKQVQRTSCGTSHNSHNTREWLTANPVREIFFTQKDGDCDKSGGIDDGNGNNNVDVGKGRDDNREGGNEKEGCVGDVDDDAHHEHDFV